MQEVLSSIDCLTNLANETLLVLEHHSPQWSGLHRLTPACLSLLFAGLCSHPHHPKVVWTELGEPLGCVRLLGLLPFNSVSRGEGRHTKYVIIHRVCVRMLSCDRSEGLWDRWRIAPVLGCFSLTDRRCFGCKDVLPCTMSTVMLVPCPKAFQLFSMFYGYTSIWNSVTAESFCTAAVVFFSIFSIKCLCKCKHTG